MTKREKLQQRPDIILKAYWADNGRFSDLFNAMFFQGKPVLKPELIQFAEKEEGEIQMVTGLKMLFDKERNEGARETCEKVALLMLKKSYPEQEIIDISQLTKEELNKLKKHL